MKDKFGHELHKGDIVYIIDRYTVEDFGMIEYFEGDKAIVSSCAINESIIINPECLALLTDDYRQWRKHRYDVWL